MPFRTRSWSASPVAAVAMLVEMPEPGTIDGKEAASLAGLAPITCKSGRSKGQSRIGGGRRGLRRALSMPGLVATRHDRQPGQTCQAPCRAGMPAKVALAAVMRKLLILPNAPIGDDRNWGETAPRSKRMTSVGHGGLLKLVAKTVPPTPVDAEAVDAITWATRHSYKQVKSVSRIDCGEVDPILGITTEAA